ncbi:type III secretion system chaperone family protein [Afifella pfennigii]|uniref:YbjN domain-containing protein n=1 Tax=Afifella pfennigii TaxID=209897 RepID=UPI00047AC42E|nr:YbjN domain-containing protein [Afifella pfennigii]
MSLLDFQTAAAADLVDLVEQIASSHDWSFDRSGEDEITVSIVGSFCDYNISISWMEELEALHLAAAFDFRVTERRKPEIMRLLALVNEQLWIGHFDLWQAEGVIMYRSALLLSEGAEVNTAQLEGLLVAALEACERYYQAFQFVIWAGKSPEEALGQVLFETLGEA